MDHHYEIELKFGDSWISHQIMEGVAWRFINRELTKMIADGFANNGFKVRIIRYRHSGQFTQLGHEIVYTNDKHNWAKEGF